jgi:hypothetical protein
MALLAVALAVAGCAGPKDTPEAAVKGFWAAMARGDREAVLKTQIYYEEGMTPEFIIVPENIEWLYLDSVTTGYDNQTRARVYYQVVFKKKGQVKTTRYRTGTMAIKKEKKWMVGRPVGSRPKSTERQGIR